MENGANKLRALNPKPFILGRPGLNVYSFYRGLNVNCVSTKELSPRYIFGMEIMGNLKKQKCL